MKTNKHKLLLRQTWAEIKIRAFSIIVRNNLQTACSVLRLMIFYWWPASPDSSISTSLGVLLTKAFLFLNIISVFDLATIWERQTFGVCFSVLCFPFSVCVCNPRNPRLPSSAGSSGPCTNCAHTWGSDISPLPAKNYMCWAATAKKFNRSQTHWFCFSSSNHNPNRCMKRAGKYSIVSVFLCLFPLLHH